MQKFKVGHIVKVVHPEKVLERFPAHRYVEVTGVIIADGDDPNWSYYNAFCCVKLDNGVWYPKSSIALVEDSKYTLDEIRQAFKHLDWLDTSFELLIEAVETVRDEDYKEYQRLKAKYE